jgi:microsomal dipeptidase-like Zn-dependent dipeptidase
VGIVGGVLLGVAFVNIGVRTGRTTVLDASVQRSTDELRGIFDKGEREPAASMTVRPGSIEPLSIHFGVVAVAVLIGVALLEGLQLLEDTLWAPAGVEIIEHVPLFPLAMIGGALLQLLIDRFDRREIVDRRMMLRIQGLALDVLIVAALATLALDVIAENIVPFLALAAAGIAWTVGVFWFLARRMIPSYGFERGLTDFGRELVAEMNRVGILIDLSHVGAKTSEDTIRASEKPVAYSHCLPAALKAHPRNKTDEQLRFLADHGGFVGVTMFPAFLPRGAESTIEDYLVAMEYTLDLVGEDQVGVGTDFTQGYGEEFFRYLNHDKGRFRKLVDFGPVVMPEGIRRIEDFPNLTAAMERRG